MLPSTNGTARSPSNADARLRARTQREAVTPVDGERTAAAARRPTRTTSTTRTTKATTGLLTIGTTETAALFPRLRREEVTARAEAEETGEVIAGKWKCPASAERERE